jgi:bacterioferritin
MKGSEAVISKLQDALASELTAIHQYVLHVAMLENKDYNKLASTLETHSRTEMKHAEALIDRILFLEGRPEVTRPIVIKVGSGVASILENDLASEKKAVDDYNAAVKAAVAAGDNGSRELLESHLRDEEGHVNYLEAQLIQLKEMGIQNYLATIS